MAVDWRPGSQGTSPGSTKLHAMAAVGQTCQQARQAADDLIRGSDAAYASDIAARIHAAQDAAAPWHYGKVWDGNITLNHVRDDVFYGPAIRDSAIEETLRILGGRK